MLILTIKSDQPQAEVGLYEDTAKLAYSSWEAHRQLANTIHSKIKDMLDDNGKGWTDIKGVIAYKGPGSFTGLRIGIATGNALAYGLKVPIVSSNGEDWIKLGIGDLLKGNGKNIVLPEYGSDPKTTQQRK